MAAWALALGGASFLGGLLDDSDETAADAAIQAARIGARKAYPGQKSIAKAITPYLWENLDKGLSTEEKQLIRGQGRTGILQGTKGTKKTISSSAASQGLRGGTIADILRQTDETTIPEYAKLENTISGLDIAKKNKSLADILGFLSLSAGEGEEANLGDLDLASTQLNERNKTIADIISEQFQKYGYGGSRFIPNYGGDIDATGSTAEYGYGYDPGEEAATGYGGGWSDY